MTSNKLNVANLRYYSRLKRLTHILFIILFLAGCGGTKEIKDGSVAYELKKYELAQQLLPTEINQTNNSEAKLTKTIQLAESFAKSNKIEQAAEWYQKAIDLSDRDEYYFELGKIQKRNEDFEAAIESFNTYKTRTNDVFYTNPELRMSEEALAYNPNKTNIFIRNIENLNSSSFDYATAIYQNKLAISSTRNGNTGELVHPWTGESTGDIYYSSINTKGYGNLEALPTPINSALPEGSITFSPDGKTAYFGRCDFPEESNGFCKIYTSTFDGFEWSEPSVVPIFDDTINVGQPFLSLDGRRLYFAANAPFGYGGNDIYFMELNNGELSDPLNAGASINTLGEELFPTTDKNGNLFFSSDGRTGYGGLDIFYAKAFKLNFEKAIHLPYPINSGGDDFGYLPMNVSNDGSEGELLEKAIFSSSRKGGKGYDDIYEYTKKLINYYQLELAVVEKQYENPEDGDSKVIGLQPLIDADVTLTNLSTKETVNATTSESGKLLFDLAKDTDYKVFVAKNNYFNQSITTSTKGVTDPNQLLITIQEEVELERIFPEKEIVIPNIYYDYDKASLRAESLPVLDTLVSFFEENSDLTIEIGSHTDSRGSNKYNQELSQRRAQSVVDYLVSKGVAAATLSAKGYGENKLTNRCKDGVTCTEEEHQENRRTTFRVISANGVLESQ